MGNEKIVDDNNMEHEIATNVYYLSQLTNHNSKP